MRANPLRKRENALFLPKKPPALDTQPARGSVPNAELWGQNCPQCHRVRRGRGPPAASLPWPEPPESPFFHKNNQ